MYYILSLKHLKGNDYYIWWAKNDMGYTNDLSDAVTHTAEEVQEKADYYNNGKSTLAVSVEDAQNFILTKLVPINPTNADIINPLRTVLPNEK